MLVFSSIDTGIDYNHPAFGSYGFGPNKRIAFGYDFAGDTYDPDIPNSPGPKPKPDPMDCDGHGTHVAVGPSRVLR
jgi:subtilisin family serine protease